MDLEYPSAFQERFLQIIRENPGRPRFRFILLSGKFVVRDQEKGLCFLEKARKLKVSRALTYPTCSSSTVNSDTKTRVNWRQEQWL